jgi:hypothetical protein
LYITLPVSQLFIYKENNIKQNYRLYLNFGDVTKKIIITFSIDLVFNKLQVIGGADLFVKRRYAATGLTFDLLCIQEEKENVSSRHVG